jgi:hypothetical protein
VLPEEELSRLRREGESMDQDQAVAYAVSEINAVLADPACGQP